jgi:hypothetical protein
LKGLTEVSSITDKEYDAWFKKIRDDRYEKLLTDWAWWRRADQCAPAGECGREEGVVGGGLEWNRAEAQRTQRLRLSILDDAHERPDEQRKAALPPSLFLYALCASARIFPSFREISTWTRKKRWRG